MPVTVPVVGLIDRPGGRFSAEYSSGSSLMSLAGAGRETFSPSSPSFPTRAARVRASS